MEAVMSDYGTYLVGGIGLLTYLALATIISGFVGYGLTKGYLFATRKK